MPKLGRKIRCVFHQDMRCVQLISGKQSCVEFGPAASPGDLDFGFCPQLPEGKIAEFLEAMKKDGCSLKRMWVE